MIWAYPFVPTKSGQAGRSAGSRFPMKTLQSFHRESSDNALRPYAEKINPVTIFPENTVTTKEKENVKKFKRPKRL